MNIQIDAKGKQCPLPVIEAKNAISGMTEAGIVEVLWTMRLQYKISPKWQTTKG